MFFAQVERGVESGPPWLVNVERQALTAVASMVGLCAWQTQETIVSFAASHVALPEQSLISGPQTMPMQLSMQALVLTGQEPDSSPFPLFSPSPLHAVAESREMVKRANAAEILFRIGPDDRRPGARVQARRVAQRLLSGRKRVPSSNG